jgi:hypothetical protein
MTILLASPFKTFLSLTLGAFTIKLIVGVIEQYILDTNAGKQQSYGATDI